MRWQQSADIVYRVNVSYVDVVPGRAQTAYAAFDQTQHETRLPRQRVG